jgi:hypothetical protein
VDQGEVVPGGLLEARGDGAKALQVVKEDLDSVATSVAASVEARLTLSGRIGVDDRFELTSLGWDYVVRFRGYVLVEHAGTTSHAGELVPSGGRARRLDEPLLNRRPPTANRSHPAFVASRVCRILRLSHPAFVASRVCRILRLSHPAFVASRA